MHQSLTQKASLVAVAGTMGVNSLNLNNSNHNSRHSNG
jgi:hypothetical protein